ncbi:MAG TPA: hypothetical protein VF427_12445 [Noviherbaspirillum sp.]
MNKQFHLIRSRRRIGMLCLSLQGTIAVLAWVEAVKRVFAHHGKKHE